MIATITANHNSAEIAHTVVHFDPDHRDDMRELISFGIVNVMDECRKRGFDAREYRIELRFN